MSCTPPESRRPAATGLAVPPLLGLVLLALLAPAAGCGQKPATIRVTPGKIVLYGVKKNAVARAEVLDKKGKLIEEAGVEWEIAPPKVATVEKSGKLVSASPGKARLTARFGELTAVIPLEVVDVAAISLLPARMTLAGPKGTTGRCIAIVTDSTGKAVDIPLAWSTSDAKLVAVDSSGVVTSVAEGRVGIAATLGDVSASSDVTVVFRDVAAFEVSPRMVPLKPGDSARLVVLARDGTGLPIEDVAVDWTSADPKTASVVGGIVTGLAPGSTTVRAVCGKNQAEVSVLVF